MVYQRADGRNYDQIRSIVLKRNVFGYAVSSVYVELGNTKLLCAITMHAGVPSFLRGKNSGWLTAEYNVLPVATHVRSVRTSATQTNNRSVEISRIIGRSLRTAVNLSAIPDMTITIDCDVLQADGGTRTAAISAAYLALVVAQQEWMMKNIIKKPLIIHEIAAISVAMIGGECLLDPTYQEDSTADCDMNFILTRDEKIIEIQGGAEKVPVSWHAFNNATVIAQAGVRCWFNAFDEFLLHHGITNTVTIASQQSSKDAALESSS